MSKSFALLTTSVFSFLFCSGCQQFLQADSPVAVIPPLQAEPEPILTPLGPPPPFPLQALNDAQPLTCCKETSLGWDEQIWRSDKQELLQAIDYSLSYLASSSAARAYRNYPFPEITRERVLNSLQRFRQLLVAAASPVQLQAWVQQEFTFYQAIGEDGWGKVLFSAYYEPIYEASRVATPEYRYPIYRKPTNLDQWSLPHPTRAELEGEDGLKSNSKIKGLELFWLKDRWQSYQIHLQGSAKLRLTDGSETSVNYAASTRRDYVSIGWELVQDGKLPLDTLTMPLIEDYFKQYPEEFHPYLNRDRSFVFFQETKGKPAKGSIQKSLTPERSIATDKSLMPPGALALIHTEIPEIEATGEIEMRPISHYVLDQDAGGAIKGPGRVDYFLGSGEAAGKRAGVTRSYGQLYYLLLK